MAKIRKSIKAALACLVLLLVGVCALTACGSKDLTVTFSIEGKEQAVNVVDGKVVFPNDPTKDYYEFRGWYTTETFDEGTEFTKDTEISENLKVYAYFSPIYVDISLNGGASEEIRLEDLSAKTDEYISDAESKNLTFDGWYIDASYGTKYSTQDADNLYARYVATVIFDNGYETVYTAQVKVDSALGQPDISDVKRYYMDEEDLSYVGENGTAFDFTAPISVNTKITVLWKTPYIEYEKIDEATWYASDFESDHYAEIGTYPCISFLSKDVTVEAGTKANVKAVKIANIGRCDSAAAVLFADGIEYVSDLQVRSGISKIETIRLPNTLKVLEKSFWSFTNLKSITLPEGLEVIMDCFWRDYNESVLDSYRGAGYDFEIKIPASVKTVTSVPMNVTFAENSDYFKDNNRIYKKDGANGRILVSDFWTNVKDGALTIDDDVTGIAVGVLNYVYRNGSGRKTYPSFIYLPSTLNKVLYTSDRTDYESFYMGDLLTNPDYLANPSNGHMSAEAYSVFGEIDDIQYIIFDTKEYPFGGENDNYLFTTSDGVPYDRYETTKLVFVAEVTEGDISVTVNFRNTMVADSADTKVLSYATGTEIIQDALLKEIGVTDEALGVKIKITSITQFGSEYVFGTKKCNQYIDVEYEFAAIGFTTSENADGTLTVTGFHQEGAQLLENGTYLLMIPNNLDGKEITAIADGAFKNLNSISKVYIGNNVRKIGAEAFMNTQNLEYVSVTPGGLEVIGRSAFENAGSVKEDGIWKINPDMPTYNKGELAANTKVQSLWLQIPLANLTSIEPYAFKTVALKAFKAVADEADERIAMNFSSMADLKENEFYFTVNSSGDKTAIVQYVSKTTEKKASCVAEGEVDVNVYDVRLIAIAGGYFNQGISQYVCLGWDLRKYAKMSETFAFHDTAVLRYEIMEGSVYFLTQSNEICFGVVSKVHAGAFSDIGTVKDGETTMPQTSVWQEGNDTWLDKEKVTEQSDEIFEEGWLNGKPNDENGAFDRLKDAPGVSILL